MRKIQGTRNKEQRTESGYKIHKAVAKKRIRPSYFVICYLLSVICYLIIACDNIADTPEIQTQIKNGYGRISIIFEEMEATLQELARQDEFLQTERTVLPSTVFTRYVYTFTKSGETTGVEKTPDNQGSFSLEVGSSYTVAVQAYLNNILAAKGESPQFWVGEGDNDPVKVRLSYVTTGEQGVFKYTITYPAGAMADITLKKWPNMEDIRLAPTTQGNRKTETLNLGTGSYLLTVIVKKDGYHAGKNEAIHIYPSFTTEYTKVFIDNDLLVEIPPTVNATGTLLIPGVWTDGNIAVSGGEWFRFTATSATQYIHASFDTLTSLSLQVYSSSGSPVGSQTNLTGNSTYTSRQLTNGQVYYIKVTPSSYDSTYQIAFNTSSVPPLTSNSAAAIELTAGVWESGTVSADSEQWFKFTANEYVQYTLETQTNLSVQVYSSSGSTVGSQTDLTGNSTYTSRTLTSGQEYYIMVWPYNPSDSGTYRIKFNATVIPELTADTWADGIIYAAGEQWFKFTATGSTQYIHVNFGTLNNLYIQVFSSTGNTVGNQINLVSDTTFTSHTVIAGQEYYIKVWPYSSFSGGTYRIMFTDTTPSSE